MIKTRNIVSSLSDVPDTFIFEHFLGLSEKLEGQEVWVTSVWNPQETRPSLSIFCKGGIKYSFKDFSSGKSGTAFQLVQQLFPDETKAQIAGRIISAYREAVAEGELYSRGEYKVFEKYKVTSFELRKFNTADRDYWTQFHINSKTLDFFNIAPIDSFVMSKEVNGVLDQKKITRRLLYGFFKRDGSLQKIYQPGTDVRFIKVRSGWIQGFDQLKFSSPNLLITKSLKDCAGFHTLSIPGYEVISPDSENQMITKQQMNTLNFYKNKVVLFDSDAAGKQASEKYKEVYGIPYIDLGMEKDLTDSLKARGVDKVKEKLIKLL